MTFGFDFFNSSGQRIIGQDDKIGRIYSTHTIPAMAINTTYNLSVPGYLTDGTFTYLVTLPASGVKFTPSNNNIAIFAGQAVTNPFELEILKVG